MGQEPMKAIRVGDSGYLVRIDPDWRVLDVGSGENPHPRADVILDRFPDDAFHRAGQPLDKGDPRLVIGDALSMPFPDGSFDYAIASHVAEHVDDPARFCAELLRVAKAGYIETPGWIWDQVIQEPFHVWSVVRTGRGLRFARVRHGSRFGRLRSLAYGIVYMGTVRPGHWTLRTDVETINRLLLFGNRVLGRLRRLPGARRLAYTCFEWRGRFPVEVMR